MLIAMSHEIRRKVYFLHSIALKTTHFPKVGNVENEEILDQGETETQQGKHQILHLHLRNIGLKFQRT